MEISISDAALRGTQLCVGLRACLKRWFASVTRHAGCPDTPNRAPGVPASAGVRPEPAEAGTPAPEPCGSDLQIRTNWFMIAPACYGWDGVSG